MCKENKKFEKTITKLTYLKIVKTNKTNKQIEKQKLNNKISKHMKNK